MLGTAFACLYLSQGAAFAEHIGIQNTPEDEKLRVIQLTEIMNGDQNGDMHLENPVTRAEFVKMAIAASSYKDSVGKGSAVSLFPDVTSTHWAAPYVSAAIRGGLVSGYLDGSFRPDAPVLLEEAVIISLKLLGYTNADFTGTYPEAQLAKYAEIDLDTDMTAVRGEKLARLDCVQLFYNLLCTKTKGGTPYATTLGHAIDADGTVDYLSLLNADMTGVFVNKDGSWKDRVSFAQHESLAVFRDGNAVSASEIDDYDVYYYSTKLKTIWCYSDKAFGKLDAVLPNRETPTSITLSGKSYALLPDAAAKVANNGGVSKDDYVMVMLDKDGNACDILLADAALYHAYADKDSDLLTEVNKTISDPVVVNDLSSLKEQIPFDLNEATILYDSAPIAPSDIRKNDVVYYSEPFHSVWVYRDTQSGVLQAISPSREKPTSITVSGKNYTLLTDEIVYKCSALGTFKTDTLVTLLLGKDGGAVDILAAGMEVVGDGEKQVSYADVVSSTLKGPFVAATDGALLKDTKIDLEKAALYKDGKRVSKDAIRAYNVYYYSELLNTVWLYDKTASGTLESVLPSGMSPTGITLSGKSYTLESDSAKFAVSSLGTVRIGDRVTLLLGKDGNVAGVVSADTYSKTIYGVVIANGEKTYTDVDGDTYKSDTVTVYATDDSVYTYAYNGGYTIGEPVKIVVSDDKVRFYGLEAPSTAAGAADVMEAVEKGRIAPGAEIIEYFDNDTYGKVLASRISGKTLSYRDVMHYELNADGEVEKLILDDFTGDLVEYGFLTEVSGSTYTYMLDDGEVTYNSGDIRFTVSPGAAYFVKNGNAITKIANIYGKTDLASVSGNVGYTAKNAAYEISDDVRVFIRENGSYTLYDLDVLENGDYTMTAYYDDEPQRGGMIRVITAY